MTDGLYLVTNGISVWLLYGTLDAEGVPDPRETSRFVALADDVPALRAHLEAGLRALDQEPRPAAPFSYPPQTGMGVPAVPPGGGQG
jgi:hypothetical protein